MCLERKKKIPVISLETKTSSFFLYLAIEHREYNNKGKDISITEADLIFDT